MFSENEIMMDSLKPSLDNRPEDLQICMASHFEVRKLEIEIKICVFKIIWVSIYSLIIILFHIIEVNLSAKMLNRGHLSAL